MRLPPIAPLVQTRIAGRKFRTSAGSTVRRIGQRGCIQVEVKSQSGAGSRRIAIPIMTVVRAAASHVLALRRLRELPDFGEWNSALDRKSTRLNSSHLVIS